MRMAFCEIVEGLIPSSSKQRWCFIGDHYVLLVIIMFYWRSLCFIGDHYVSLAIIMFHWRSLCFIGDHYVLLAIIMFYWRSLCFIGDHYVSLVIIMFHSFIHLELILLPVPCTWMIWRRPTSQSQTGSSVCSNKAVLLVVQSVSVKLQWHLTTIISATLQRHPISFLQDYSGTSYTSVSCCKKPMGSVRPTFTQHNLLHTDHSTMTELPK